MPSRNSYSLVSEGWPPAMIEALAVVPPMSNTIRSASPPRWPISTAPATPPAGPEATAKTGLSVAEAMPIIPPLEAMTCSEALTPMRSRSSRSRAR
ncbi:hypothetical protein D3C71_1731950 [compost metagenome]